MKQIGLEEILGGMLPPEQEMDEPELLTDEFFEAEPEEEFNEQAEAPDFQENLAESLDDSYLDKIASEMLDWVDDDDESRSPFMDVLNSIRDELGIGNDAAVYEQPFPGSSTVVYPIITKAQIQFQARSLPEIFPDNPAKAVVVGESTPELEDQASRVADVLNYQIGYQDKGNKKDFRKMLWWLPLTGSTFRYVYHNPLRNINMARFVPVEDFIVPYGTTSLEDAPRFTHRMYDTKNDLMKLMRMGFYLTVDLSDEDDDEINEKDNTAQKIRDDSDSMEKGEVRTSNNSMQAQYNIYTEYDLEGFEDLDEDGQPTGIGLPYVFTIHARSRKILAIRRNWKEYDEKKEKRIYFAHYKYQEGAGFYGSGLPHLIGSLQIAATGALRAFGDSMAFSMLQAGWKLKDATFSGSAVFSPGNFQDVDSTMDDINKAIKVANFAPPTPQALTYIQMLEEQAQTIVSTTDIMTGDQSPQNSPVGSTLAMIEQAQKVITAQHKSLFEALTEELQIMADLNYDFLPDQGEFRVPGKIGIIQRADFDGRVDVLPTADPSVASFQQRQAIDQACMQMFMQFPKDFKKGGFPLRRRVMKNLMVPALDELMYTEEEYDQVMAQEAQNPPPPSPEEIDAQVAQQDAQTKAATAQTKALNDREQLSIADRKLDLEEKKVDNDFILKNKEIDIKGMVASTQVIGTADSLANSAAQRQGASHKQLLDTHTALKPDPKMQQQAQAPTQPQAQPQPQPEAPQKPQADPEKRNMLLRLIDKVRGK